MYSETQRLGRLKGAIEVPTQVPAFALQSRHTQHIMLPPRKNLFNNLNGCTWLDF
jgi:hypothetical protein